MNDPDAGTATDTVVPVCLIGGSAGGLKSIQAFFAACATDLGYAYVVVMHLDPEQPSELEGILARASTLPMETAHDGQVLRPDHVYVCPPAVQPRVANDRLRLSPVRGGRTHASLDEVLYSMTERRSRDSVAIFSGASADGLLGVQAFKEHGLDVLAQTPADAEFSRMPQAIVDRGLADVVGTPPELAARLAEIRRSIAAGLAEAVNDERALQVLLDAVHTQTGLDFRQYKRGMIRRRVMRRMAHLGIADVETYARRIAAELDEAWRLGREFLIPVTRFFRDPEAFKALGERVRARLAQREGEAREGEAADFRVWVAGCASGEEAYSVTITVLEAIEESGSTTSLQVFATDVDERAVALARAGTYVDNALADVPEDVRAKWFKMSNAEYQVRQGLRDRIVFAPHNLLKDPPFMDVDLIVCRNVFIYFEPAAQAQVARAFRYALREGGLLMLSPAETIPADGGDFVTANACQAIFAADGTPPARRAVPSREATPRKRSTDAAGASKQLATKPKGESQAQPAQLPQLVVDAHYQLQQLHGDAGRFLTMPAGAPTGNLLRLIRPELLAPMRYVLSACFREGEPAHAGPVVYRSDDHRRAVLLHAAPEPGKDERAARAIVTFFVSTGPGIETGENDDAETGDPRVLEQENQDLRRRLDTVEQDYASAIESLTESNQELQSVNEEYRSTTEELQASQEELKSLNEELKTVNDELREKYNESRTAHAHLNALMSATEFGTLFVKRDRTIGMMTPKIAEVFSVEPRDVGRNLSGFTHALKDCDPLALLAEAERSGAAVERTVRHRDGRWLLLRARAFYDDEPGEPLDGLVLSVVDVTRLQEAERSVRARDEQLRRTLQAGELVAARYDRAADELSLAGAIPGVFWADMPAQMDAESFLTCVDAHDRESVRSALLADGGAGRVELEFRARMEDREPRLIAATGERVEHGSAGEVLLTFRNISAFKRVEAENEAKAHFLAKMSHELRTPLNAISGMADSLRSIDALGSNKAKRDEYLDDILFSAGHLTDLVNDLLDIARLENDAAAQMADFDVQATLESVVKLMQPLAEEKGIALDLKADAPATQLHAHERSFRQVLFNLIGNAIKYCPEGSSVTLDFRRRGDATKAMVSVIDDGPGIPERLLHRIGTAFIHVEDPGVRPTAHTGEPGLGIGLSIVEQILRAHKGEMRVHSVPGRGTNMVTIWPLASTAGR